LIIAGFLGVGGIGWQLTMDKLPRALGVPPQGYRQTASGEIRRPSTSIKPTQAPLIDRTRPKAVPNKGSLFGKNLPISETNPLTMDNG
jgi:hypothetical protein